MTKLTLISFFVASFISLVIPQLAHAQMEFVENKGQWHDNVQYQGDFNSGAFFLEKKGFSVLLKKPADVQRLADAIHGHSQQPKSDGKFIVDTIIINEFQYNVKFLGASDHATRVPDKKLPTHNNYFLGDNPSKWASDCSVYGAVTYQNIYPNIDIRYYSDAGRLKYDFIVKPGGNPDYIAMQYSGPKDIYIKDKKLVIPTPAGDIEELDPFSYQSQTGKRQQVSCRYVIKNNLVTFKLGDYNRNATLIIDPSIIFSTFTGSTADNWGYTATPGPDGSFYAGGIAFGNGYKVSPGAYQTTFGGGQAEGSISGGYDIAIFKFSPSGNARLYATYLGGSGNEQPHSMIVDGQGDLIVAGRSNSANYPKTMTQVGPGGGYDIIVTKFNSTGTALLGSIKMGGGANDGVNIKSKYPTESPGTSSAISLRRNYGDDARSEVILDAANNIYLASCTQSSDFPVVTPVQGSFGGGLQDGAIIKFNANLNTVLFSTYFGGSGDDACFVANIDPITGDLFVAGGTGSPNLPGNKAGVISPNFNSGVADGFVTHLKSNGSAIVRTTYLGTGGTDIIYGLKFDRLGYPYVMGTTTGNWPVINANFKNVFGTNNAKQFISKLEPDLSAFIYSTVFGTNSSVPNISPIAFLVDRCENVYVSGWGGGINVNQEYTIGNTTGMPEVNPLAGLPAPDGQDFYFFVLEKNANSQLFGSHFGQNGGLGDHVDGGTSRFDDNGVIYQALCANCNRQGIFPTTPGVWATTNGSNGCNEAAVKIEMNFAGVGAAVQTSIDGIKRDTTGCVPLTVDFADTLLKGKKYYWDFGDGSPVQITTTATVPHTYTAIGSYRVKLIAEDSSTCNVRDSSFVTIKVGDNKALLDFNFAKVPPCQSLTMVYTNISTTNRGSFGPRSFVWDYGDGSPRDTTGLTPPRVHTYAASGTYNVKLFIYDTAFCNSPDSLVKTIRLNPIVKAQFNAPPLGCVPFTAVFENTSLAGVDFIWDFGDGTTSNQSSPTHVYNVPGTYNVRLIAIDTSTCNKVDTSAYQTVTVVAIPTASFTWSPNPPIENTPVVFTNLSIGATRYKWYFGDGDSSTATNPVHQYEATGKYNATLIAFNNANCTDTFSLDVDVIIIPLLDVPNAFTPAQGGRNAIVKVEGFGIKKMIWKIYNRQGLLVFQSENKNSGWDGTYKGKLQAMDVYAYTLDVEFSDGKKLRKTGDITLLR